MCLFSQLIHRRYSCRFRRVRGVLLFIGVRNNQARIYVCRSPIDALAADINKQTLILVSFVIPLCGRSLAPGQIRMHNVIGPNRHNIMHEFAFFKESLSI